MKFGQKASVINSSSLPGSLDQRGPRYISACGSAFGMFLVSDFRCASRTSHSGIDNDVCHVRSTYACSYKHLQSLSTIITLHYITVKYTLGHVPLYRGSGLCTKPLYMYFMQYCSNRERSLEQQSFRWYPYNTWRVLRISKAKVGLLFAFCSLLRPHNPWCCTMKFRWTTGRACRDYTVGVTSFVSPANSRIDQVMIFFLFQPFIDYFPIQKSVELTHSPKRVYYFTRYRKGIKGRQVERTSAYQNILRCRLSTQLQSQ